MVLVALPVKVETSASASLDKFGRTGVTWRISLVGSALVCRQLQQLDHGKTSYFSLFCHWLLCMNIPK